MASNLDPSAVASFVTTNMLLDSGDDLDEGYIQNDSANAGFNFLGTSNKPNISFGTKSIDLTGSTTTTIDFGADKINGVSDFLSTNYVVLLMMEGDNALNDFDYALSVETKNTGDCVIRSRGNETGTHTFAWLAFGN